MPRGGYTIGQGLADAGRAIGGGLSNKWAAEEEERRRKAQAAAFVRSSGLDRSNPELARQIANGDIGIEEGMKAEKMKADRAEAAAAADAFMQSKRQDLDINLANRAVEDPNATRGNLDLGPKPKQRVPLDMGINLNDRMGRGQQTPATMGFMGQEKPNPAMTGRLSDIQSGTPAITPDERAHVLRSELRPGDEGLAGVAGRARSMAGERQKGIDTAEAEDAWKTFESGLQGGGKPMDVGTLGKMKLSDNDRMKYAGMTPDKMQERALNGEPSEGPKWSKEDQQTVDLLAQQGIPEFVNGQKNPAFAQAYVDQKKQGATANQERSYNERVKFMEIEQLAAQLFPAPTSEQVKAATLDTTGAKKAELDAMKKAAGDWIRKAKLDYLRQNPVNSDPKQREFDALMQRLEALDASIDAEMNQ